MIKRLKAILRLFLFKNVWRIERISANSLIRLGYYLKCSRWFKEYNSPFFVGARNVFYDYIINSENLKTTPITFIEFGVCEGHSFFYWMNNCKSINSEFVGFDTFEGIPEDWGSVKKGAFSINGKILEINDSRAKFVIGLFSDTLKNFLDSTILSKRKVIHLDADLYSSTLYVLIHLHAFLKKDDIIIFDEFFSVTKADYEFRAFVDYLAIYPLKYIPIAKSCNQLAIKVI
jgi:hypothetical protein